MLSLHYGQVRRRWENKGEEHAHRADTPPGELSRFPHLNQLRVV